MVELNHMANIIQLKLTIKNKIENPAINYNNKKKLKLNKWGKGNFTHFIIYNENITNSNGIYFIIVDSRIKYVGESQNIIERFNKGYGIISPRNCYMGGQSTNCKINTLISNEIYEGKKIMIDFLPQKKINDAKKNKQYLKQKETELIAKLQPEWNC